MCGSIKYKGKTTRIGTPIEIETTMGPRTGPWTGFARSEGIETTWRNRVMKAILPADSYIEHGVEFKVPPGKGILAGVVHRPFKGEPGQVVIITRDAETPEEVAVHPRHPVFVDVFILPDGKVYIPR